jgi:hypothetical protein
VEMTIPLPTLLSQVLVAFTIELDKAFEQQMPHRTTLGRGAGQPAQGPWLVSWPMWSTFMKFVPDDGIRVKDLLHRGFLPDSVLKGRNPGMVRWGYVTMGPEPATGGRTPAVGDWVVRATTPGRRAQDIWRTLPGIVEDRWSARFGEDVIGSLRASLTQLVDHIEFELPDYLPENASHSGRVLIARRPLPEGRSPPPDDLPALLAKVVLAFTLDYERDAPLSLVMSANPVRVLEDDATLRDLARLTGVGNETLRVMVRYLERQGVLAFTLAGRAKAVRLTTRGERARRDYFVRLAAVEADWLGQFGGAPISELRRVFEGLVGDTALARSPLAAAVESPPGCWRAQGPNPLVLPHHPVISHRGGYPDGS